MAVLSEQDRKPSAKRLANVRDIVVTMSVAEIAASAAVKYGVTSAIRRFTPCCASTRVQVGLAISKDRHAYVIDRTVVIDAAHGALRADGRRASPGQGDRSVPSLIAPGGSGVVATANARSRGALIHPRHDIGAIRFKANIQPGRFARKPRHKARARTARYVRPRRRCARSASPASDQCRFAETGASHRPAWGASCAARRAAFGVSASPPPARTRSGSPSTSRNRASARLIAGCDKPTSAAAWVTLRRRRSASSGGNRLRSRPDNSLPR